VKFISDFVHLISSPQECFRKLSIQDIGIWDIEDLENRVSGNWSSEIGIWELYVSGKCPVQEIGIRITDFGKRYIQENSIWVIHLSGLIKNPVVHLKKFEKFHRTVVKFLFR
jgi:hypothetical protein